MPKISTRRSSTAGSAASSPATSGLPQPVELDRYEPGEPLIDGDVLLGAAPGGRLAGSIARVLAGAGVSVKTELEGEVRAAAGDAGLDAGVWNPDVAGDARFKALVFDATGIADSVDLHELWEFFHPTIRAVQTSGRVVVLGLDPGLVRLARGRRPRSARWRASPARSARRSARAHPPSSSRSITAPRMRSTRPFASCSRRARPTSPARSCASPSRSPRSPRSTGTSPFTARSRWSPARRAASAPPSRTCSRATALMSSGSTCPPWRRT